MDNIVVADKASSEITAKEWGSFQLDGPGVVQMPVAPSEVASVNRSGQNLIVNLKSGERVTVGNFFTTGANDVQSDIVFQGDDGTLWQAQYSSESFNGFTFEEVSSIDTLLADTGVVGGATQTFAFAGLGLLGAGGAAAAAGGGGGGGGGGSDGGGSTPAPSAPADLVLSPDGLSLQGSGTAGSTINVRDANGNLLGSAIVGSDGRFTVPLNTPQNNGQPLVVDQTDAAGNTSPTTPITAPDVVAPDAPTSLQVSADGLTLSGIGEAGATVSVRDANGNLLGTAVVAADGTFAITLSTPQVDGQTLTIQQTDAAGNVSASTPAVAPDVDSPDVTPPAAPTSLQVSADGRTLSGIGEAGATVSVRDANGNLLGTAVVAADGTFAITLSTPQVDGQTLTIQQTDAAGNVSASTPAVAPDVDSPDVTPPAAPANLQFSADGLTISGTGEAGATVFARDANGAVLGTAVVAADGTFALTLSSAQVDGQVLSLQQTDPAGNTSTSTNVAAPDIDVPVDTTPPSAPTELTVSGDGTLLSGRGEVGARVQVFDNAGGLLGTAVVGADGLFAVTLSPAQVDGQALNVTLTDAAGNPSTGTPVTAPDVQPSAPTDLAVSADGQFLTGRAFPGFRIFVRTASGVSLGAARVGADGLFSVALSPAQLNGEPLDVSAVDAAGNSTGATVVSAPDTVAPASVTELVVSPDGATIAGKGQPGATVTVQDAGGQVLASGVVASNGTFILALAPAVPEGDVLSVSQTDASGLSSTAETVTVPDATGPVAPGQVALDPTGTVVTGTGTPGTTIEVRDATGNVLGTAVVDPQGNFSVPLNTPQTDGQLLDVVAIAPDGTESVPTLLPTTDTTAPLQADDLAINPNGLVLTGRGEPGATVTVSDAQGTVLGTAVVGATGTFSVTFGSPQNQGQTLQVTLTDAAGNDSTPASVLAPNPLGALEPDNITLDPTGTTLSGTGQIGSTVTVSDASGAVLGSAVVGADGTFNVPLNSPQNNGQSLQVSAVGASGEISPPVAFTGQDTLAPDAVGNLSLSADRTQLTGTGEIGAQVTVRDGSGAIIGTALVDGNGAFVVPLAPTPAADQLLQVVQADLAGNISDPATISAPDLQNPDELTNVVISANGAVVSGNGEQGATVTVFDADNNPIGSGVVGSNGRFEITLTPAQANGQALTASQADVSGNISPVFPIIAPDIQAPAAPANLALAADGLTLTGTGEPQATLQVFDADGNSLGTGQVNADGTFSLQLDTVQLNGQALEVVQTDAALNPSAAGQLIAPDTTAPAPVDNLVITANGATLTGTGEAGSTVTVTGPGSAVLGTALVDANGVFSVALTPAQINGQALSVTQSDGTNVSTPEPITAPNLSAPAQPADLAVDATGVTLTGTAQAGTTVEARAADGTVLGSGPVDINGDFSITLAPPQLNGESLELVVTDAGGRTSVPLPYTVPDNSDPAAADNLQVSPDGLIVSGTGEPNTTVTVSRGGIELGTATVGADGIFVVTLTDPAVNGDTLDVLLTDAAGNTSPNATLPGPDGTQLLTPTNLVISPDGLTLTGIATPNSTVTVTGATGQLLGTSIPVAADGTFSVQLSAAQLNGEVLHATASDGVQQSVPGTITAIDSTAPVAPTELVLSADGSTITGRAEAGASVTVRNAGGDVLGTATASPTGLFIINLTPAQLNAQTLLINQTDLSNNTSPDGTLTATDLQAPVAPAQLSINDAGTVVSGTGEAGATVTIRDSSGAVLITGVIVDPSGNFQATLPQPQLTGALLQVELTDAAGNTSTATNLPTVDRTPPDAVTALNLSPDGVTLVGRGEAGATVQIRDANGTVLGTALVGANGQFVATLAPAPTNGETLGVVQLDTAGNVSSNVNLSAVDISPPAALSNVVINGNGLTVSGQGEPSATVFVRDVDGNILGSGVVAANGSFSVTLTPAQTNAQLLTINQEDPPGNEGPAVSLNAPDLVAPVVPDDLALNASGLQVTGSGEAGSTITVSDAAGRVLGSGVVAANGTFQVTLSDAQLNGQLLSVTSRDAAGNVSDPGSLTAADTTAPIAVTALAVSADGATITGLGEAGAVITVTRADGVVLGTGNVAGDGTFSLSLTPAAQTNALLTVVQTDLAGNESPDATVTAPGGLAPDTPSNLTLAADGLTMTGSGTPRSFITVRRFNGTLLGTAQVADDGNFSVALSSAQVNGEALSVSAAFSDGLSSLPAQLVADDSTAPAALLEYRLASDGVTLIGRGEAGATVQVTNQDGVQLGTALVAADGTFTAALDPAQTGGQQLSLIQTDAAGNESVAVNLTAPDREAPAPATGLALDASGLVLSGTGEAGASVVVRDATGAVLGSGVVRVDGTFQINLTGSQLNGQALAVTLTDAAGNASAPAPLVAADTTAPLPLSDLAIAGDGLTVTGRGEPGATITVSDNAGNPVGTGAVDATGAFTLTLDTPQTNAELLSLIQTDAALNASLPASLTAPDSTPPAPLQNVAINASGTLITGTGEPGALLNVLNNQGQSLGTTQILADGTFTITLTPAQINLEALTVQQADVAGNVGDSAGVIAPDLTPPAAPTALVISASGDQLTGAGEANTQVRIILADGTLVGSGAVDANGTFTIALNPPSANGAELLVVLVDAAQNVSNPGSITAPDITAPSDVANLLVSLQGDVLTGTGEPGATVTVTVAGVPLGIATVVASDGTFSIALTPAQLNGEALSVIQTDEAGNPSTPALVTAPDTTLPDAPANFALIDAGLTLTGTGEPGATVQVRNGNQGILGIGIVAEDGTFNIGLNAAQLNAETLNIRQLDPAGNTSPDATYQVPDVTAAAAVSNLALTADGLTLTGIGQAGAAISVTVGGVSVSSAVVTVAADGSFSIPLDTAQLNGQLLSVTQTDASNIASTPATYLATDVTAPGIPTIDAATITATSVSGTAEVGSTVTIRAADGTSLGSAVADGSGNYTVPLSPSQDTGAPLSATASDAAGNASAAVPFFALDTTDPVPVTELSINAGLNVLSGVGEPGATVTVTYGAGTTNSALVAANGTFTINLTAVVAANDELVVVQADASGNISDPASLFVPINPPTASPTALVLSDEGATLSGLAIAGSTVEVRAPGGASLGTTTATAEGTFSLTLSPAQNNGETYLVTASTLAGGTSAPVVAIAPDGTDPDPLANLGITAAGTLVTGTGEAGATVVIRNAAGTQLGTTIVAANGSFSVTLSSAQTNGQILDAVQTDPAGNVSPVSQVTALDTTPPLLATALSLAAGGLQLSGSGEAGAAVTVTNAAGAVLGTGAVDVNGTFSLTLNAPQTNGEVLTVTLQDAALNISLPATLVAADTTAPVVPTNLTVVASGLQLTGIGEAGATVRVTSANGTALGSALVAADGTFTVLLAAAQQNGQVLQVTQTDAAGNVSPALPATAPDSTAPLLATNLSVAANGASLSGNGEVGATANVYNAAGTLLGTAVVDANGAFTATLSPVQNDGQALNVRLTDGANNISLPANIIAPDTTPPVAPATAVINSAGTLVTGTGLAGSRIVIRSVAGTQLGAAVVGVDGVWAATLSPAQTNFETLNITQLDAAGNVSAALPISAPDLTAPVAASGLVLTVDGGNLSGSAEAGATVTVKNAAGATLGTSVALGNGTFSVNLSSPQINGETLNVSVTDPRGNVSLTVNLVAPDIDVDRAVLASDNLATATVNLSAVTTTRSITDSFPTLIGLGFSHTFSFTVAGGTTATPTLTLIDGGLLNLNTGATYALQVKDASGNWVTLGTAGNGAQLNLELLAGSGVRLDIPTLQAGDYRIVFSSNSLSLLTTINSTLQLDTTSLTQVNGAAGAAVTGNVISDIGTDGTVDITGPDNGAVLRVQNGGSGYVNAGAGTTVQGLYGTLTIDGQGNYTYRANGSASSVGKVDVFSYQLVHPNGKSDTANLYVRIDSPQATEVWSSTDLAAPALVVDATNDLASTNITLGNLVTTNTSTIGTLNTLLGLGSSGQYTFSVAPDTVSDLTLTLSSSSLLSVLGSVNLGLYKLNTATNQYVLVKSWGGASLLSLGGGVYGVNVDDQTPGTYRVNLSVGGAAVATSVAVGVINSATHTNQLVVNSYTPVSGNLLTDTAGGGADTLGSTLTVLSVMAAAGVYVQPGFNGTSITGSYGTLQVYADGTYSYALKAGLTNAVIGQADVFTYQLTHPNGTTDTATLTIDLDQAGAARASIASFDDDGSSFSTLAASTGAETITGTEGNDTLDGSHGGAITLEGGAGNDTLIISDQDFVSVDGGTGTDTLLWAGGDASIDLGNLQSRISNIEVIDLNDTSAVHLTLNLSDLLAVTEADNSTLFIKGNEQDSVHMTGQWTAEGTQLADGLEYTQYTPQEDPTHHLWVQNGIQVV